MRAAIYCRISPKPGDAEASVDRQEKDSREVCARNGWTVTHLFTDLRRSAWQRNRKRPGWDALLEAIRRRQVDVIVIWHPDRLMRQPWDFEELLHACGEHGVQLHGQAGGRDLSNPDDVFILRIEVAHACRSSDDTSRRVRRALTAQAAEGRPHGGARPYGYRTAEDGGWEQDPDQAGHVRWMVEQFLTGRTVNSLVNDLNGRRVPSKTGRRWSNQAVRGVLTSPSVAGLRSHKGALTSGVWEPIITPGQREEVLRLMTATRQPRKYGDREYLLRGLVRCGLCAAKMQGMFSGTAHYRCPSPALGGCGKVKVVAAPVEQLIDVWCRRELADLTLTTTTPDQTEPSEDKRDRQLLKDLATQLGELEISMDEYRAARAPIVQRRKDRERERQARPLHQMAGVGPAALLAAWDDPEAVTADMRRATYLTLLDAVFIDPVAARTGPRFQPERVRPLRAGNR